MAPSAGLAHSIFHGEYVALSFGLAIVGAYVGIHLCEQFRLSSRENQSKLLSRQMLMVLMACSIGGVAIWSMHFVGMAAVSFQGPDGVRLPLSYRYDFTFVSLAVVIILCYAGIYICSRDAAFMIDKIDTIDAFIENTRNLSITEIRKIKTSATMVMILALTKSPLSLLIGGVVTASGVCVMHYIGMSAVVIDADLVWEPGIVAASVLIAIVAATAAYWILFRLLALYPQIELLRLASSIVAAVAVNGMHYTGMAAATYVYKPGQAAKTTVGIMDSNTAVIGAIVASMVFLWIVVLLVLADVRSWFYRSANTVRMADKLISLMEQESTLSGNTHKLLGMYLLIRGDNLCSDKLSQANLGSQTNTAHGSIHDPQSMLSLTRGSNHSGPNSGTNSFHGLPDAADLIEAAHYDTSDHVIPFSLADIDGDEESKGRSKSPGPGPGLGPGPGPGPGTGPGRGGLVRGVSILGQNIDSLSAPGMGNGSKGASHRDMTGQRSNTNSRRTSLVAASAATAAAAAAALTGEVGVGGVGGTAKVAVMGDDNA